MNFSKIKWTVVQKEIFSTLLNQSLTTGFIITLRYSKFEWFNMFCGSAFSIFFQNIIYSIYHYRYFVIVANYFW